MRSDKINNFLNVFDGILFNAHYVRLQFIQSKLFECDGGNMKTSIHGNHMNTCVWSNDAAIEEIFSFIFIYYYTYIHDKDKYRQQE